MRFKLLVVVLVWATLVSPAQAALTPSYVSQFGSSGTGNGQFSGLSNIAVGPDGSIYTLEATNNRVQKFDSAGVYVTKWGSTGTGDGQFSGPFGLGIDAAGNIYVADTENDRVQKFDSAGTFLLKFGTVGSGNGQLNSPNGVAVDSAGNIYVTDTTNFRVQKFDSAGAYVAQWGASGTGDGQFDTVFGITIDSSDNLYVGDVGVNVSQKRIQKFNTSGAFITKWGSSGSGNGQFNGLRGLAVDASANVYTIESANHRVQRFNNTGSFYSTWGSNGSGDSQFSGPFGVAFATSSQSVFVADTSNTRVQKFTYFTPTLASLGPTAFVNGSVGIDSTPTLTFTTADTDTSDTVAYELTVDDSSNFSSPVYQATSSYAAVGDVSTTTGSLSDGSYYWRVLAGDANATTSYSTANSGAVAFIVDTTAPGAGTIAFSAVTATALVASTTLASDATAGLASTYQYRNTTSDTYSGETSTTGTFSSLTPNTSYSVEAGVKDLAGNWATSTAVATTTLANPPTGASAAADSSAAITVSWNANSNPAGTEYYVANTTAGTNSGWITTTSWQSGSLTAATSYSFTVKARNSAGAETATASASASTEAASSVSGGGSRRRRPAAATPPAFPSPALIPPSPVLRPFAPVSLLPLSPSLSVPTPPLPEPTARPSPAPVLVPPADQLFAKLAGRLVPPPFHLIAGQELTLVIRPSGAVGRVAGQLVLSRLASVPVPVKSDWRKWVAAAGFGSVDYRSAPLLSLGEFNFSDPDGDGVYEATLTTPAASGEYEVLTTLEFRDSVSGRQVLRLRAVVDPEGYVYEAVAGGELRLSGATVSLFAKDPGTGQFRLWPADEFRQVNPRVTGRSGAYAFLAPPGDYYLTASAPGYRPYRGPVFIVALGGGVHTNLALEPSGWRRSARRSTLGLLLLVGLGVILKLTWPHKSFSG